MKGEQGQDLDKNIDIANSLNKHFNSIGHKLASKIKPVSKENIVNLPEPPENSIYMFKTSEEEIRKLIDNLKSNKATGLDGINSYIIKISAITIIPTLVLLFIACLAIGSFPDALKIACIVPLYKEGDRTDSSNYRPISLLPLFGKLFEKVIKKEIRKVF